MAISILQPDESQTFYFRYGPYGEEHYFTAKEVLQKMRDYYQQNFDTVIFLPYAYDTFGYFIGGAQIGSGSDDTMLLGNEDYSDLSSRISTNQFVAVSPLYSGIILLRGFDTDGSVSYSFGSIGYNTLYQGPPDGNTIWNFVSGDYDIPFVLYTECECNHLYINGEEYFKGNATVKVNYYIPSGDYQFTKLTYKKDKEPASVNDGTIVNLDMTQTEAIVDHLEENSTYYFTIFTDISESNSVSFTVEPNPVPPEYREAIQKINSDSVDNGFFWKNTNSFPLKYHTEYNISVPSASLSYFSTSSMDNIVTSNTTASSMYYTNIVTVNVTSSGSTYSFNHTFTSLNDIVLPPLWGNPNAYAKSFSISNNEFLPSGVGSSIQPVEFIFSFSGNLTNVVNYLSIHCRNVNIYVDGVLWSKVS